MEAENVSRQRHIITSQLYKSNCFVLANVAAADCTMSVCLVLRIGLLTGVIYKPSPGVITRFGL